MWSLKEMYHALIPKTDDHRLTNRCSGGPASLCFLGCSWVVWGQKMGTVKSPMSIFVWGYYGPPCPPFLLCHLCASSNNMSWVIITLSTLCPHQGGRKKSTFTGSDFTKSPLFSLARGPSRGWPIIGAFQTDFKPYIHTWTDSEISRSCRGSSGYMLFIPGVYRLYINLMLQ